MPLGQTDWSSIIYRGVESEELDYKAAQDWNSLSRSGKAKFVRHCIALANSKGGYIVVGVGEDGAGRPTLYTGLTEKQSRSFDPTPVGNFINNYVEPELDFTIERPVVDGRRYAIFVVRRFSGIPHVCTYGCEGELQQGVFYIRTAEASSRPAFRAHELHGLIQRSLRNQREQLGRMLRGILYENSNGGEVSDEVGLFKEQRNLSRDMLKSRRYVDFGKLLSFEFSAWPVSGFEPKRFSLSELRVAVEKSVYMFPRPLFISNAEVNDSYSTNVSIRSLPEGSLKIWQVFRSGFVHFLEFQEPGGMDYRQLMLKLGEGIFFLCGLYTELGYSDDMFELDIRLGNMEGQRLNGLSPRSNRRQEYRCHIPEIRVSFLRTLADLASGPEEHAARALRDICERFNVPASRHEDVAGSVRVYLGERLP